MRRSRIPRVLTATLASLLQVSGCGREGPASGTPLRISHGRRDAAKVALTFDACSTAEDNRADGALLDAIRASGLRATLFLGGIWMEHNQALVRRLAAMPGLELGLHGWGHRHAAELSDAALEAEFSRSDALFRRLAGRPPRLYRPPYGTAVARDLAAATRRGLDVVEFDVPAGDSDPRASAARLTRWVLGSARPGSVIIFHMNGRGVHTAEALPGIAAGLRSKGLACVTVGELAGELRAISR